MRTSKLLFRVKLNLYAYIKTSHLIHIVFEIFLFLCSNVL